MKELVIISGKGGTGKTSLVASFAALAKEKVLVDCDVDAADLHLVLNPSVEEDGDFSGGKKARVLEEDCVACGACLEACRFDALIVPEEASESGIPVVNPIFCEGCGVCFRVCPADAIAFEPVVNGRWFLSQTRYGPLVHAKLGIAEGNSGKLVSLLREKARAMAEEKRIPLILIDGSPGIGCPVIASITGSNHILVVTEPTLSGRHDLFRVLELASHFRIPVSLCVNKWDLNPEMTARIEEDARKRSIPLAGRVSYDPAVTKAQIAGTTVVEFTDGPVSGEIRALWEKTAQNLGS